MTSTNHLEKLLSEAGVVVNGTNPWDPQVHNPKLFERILAEGRIAVGESYMDGWWDVEDMTEMFSRILRKGNFRKIDMIGMIPHFLKAYIFNLQNKARAFEVGEKHYDIGNELYEKMLDKRLTYTCGYWTSPSDVSATPQNLDEAQEAKLHLVAKKIGLKKGDRVLDIGGGWGSFAGFAAEKYGAEVVAITVSKEQAALGREKVKGLPVEIRVQDYRDVQDGPYDHIVSIGMFEHVGHKNYRTYFEKARELLKEDGFFLLHTIGAAKEVRVPDPWFDTYIFPNGILPSVSQIGKGIDGLFVMEDWHNFGADYDTTLQQWFKNFNTAWPSLKDTYGDRFYRMWRFYLLGVAGGFRARTMELWQVVLSPKGVPGGYTSVR